MPPTTTTYILNQVVASSFNCVDSGSGIGNCSAPATVDTSSIGSKIFTVNATDNVGNTSTASVNFTVAFKICALYDQTKSHKLDSTVPFKLQLCDVNGVNYSSAGIVVHATSLTKVDSNASTSVDDSGAANSPDNNFRYDA